MSEELVEMIAAAIDQAARFAARGDWSVEPTLRFLAGEIANEIACEKPDFDTDAFKRKAGFGIA